MSEQGLFGKLFGGQHGREAQGSVAGGYFTYDTEAPSFTREEQIRAMDDLLGRVTSMELPDAIDMIMLEPSDDEPRPGDGFARYAARLLSEVGASRIRQLAASFELSVIRLSANGAFWMRMPYHEMSAADRACAFAAESALNRLLFVRDIFAAQSEGMTLSEQDCFAIDHGWVNNIVIGVERALEGLSDNPLLDLYGARGARGGEWDVRCRFALFAEQLRLPFRLTYSFDCDVKAGLLRVDFSAPLAQWFSQRIYDQELDTWVDGTEQASIDAARYSLGLGALLAATAFGTSVGICGVHLVGHRGDIDGEEAFSLFVDRLPFVAEVVPLTQEGGAAWLDAFIERARSSDDGFDRTLRANHHAVQSDMRPLPPGLGQLLHAQTVSDLDVISDMPTDSWDSIHAAEADRSEAPLAAIAVLEDAAAQGDAALDGLDIGTLPLYCSDSVARFLLPLVGEADGTQFVRYSDAAFRARSILCDLYSDMGEPDRAIQQAQHCIELAPTSTIGYTDQTNALFNKQDHEGAVPVLTKALSLATNTPTIAFIYYRLAFALWQSGRHEEALASYVLCSFHNFARPEVVMGEMNELLSDMAQKLSGERPGVPTVPEARETLVRAGIPLAPTTQVCELVASVIIELVDAGYFDACAPLVRMIAATVSHRDELHVVASSLEGTP